MIYAFFLFVFVQKSFLTKKFFLHVEINLTTRGQLYTCLVIPKFNSKSWVPLSLSENFLPPFGFPCSKYVFQFPPWGITLCIFENFLNTCQLSVLMLTFWETDNMFNSWLQLILHFSITSHQQKKGYNVIFTNQIFKLGVGWKSWEPKLFEIQSVKPKPIPLLCQYTCFLCSVLHFQFRHL